MATKQRRQQEIFVGLGVGLAAFLLYLATLAPTVLEADGGEFQFVAWLPGIAHPTGYPLYVLLGWLWTHALPVGEVAWRMNLLSAVLAALTVGVVYSLARQMLDRCLPETPRWGRLITAAGTAATFAVTPTFWSQAIIAEVYALHALFVAVVLWLVLKVTARWPSPQPSPTERGSNVPPSGLRPELVEGGLGGASAKLLTLTFGLSLTHHRTMVLLLPALGLFLYISRRNQAQPTPITPKLLLTHALLFIAPLLLYLYLPLIAPVTPYATLHLSDSQTLTLYDNSLRGFWDHLMGTVFSGDLQPAAAGLDRLLLTWQLLRQQVGWLGVGLALLGLATLWQRDRALLLLTGLAGLGFIAFNLIYFIGDVFVLFIPVWLLVTLWLGLGGLGLIHTLAQRFTRSRGTSGEALIFTRMGEHLEQRIYGVLVIGLVTGLLGGLVVTLAVQNIVLVSQQGNVQAKIRWQEILAEPLPDRAVLISNDRNEIMPLWYYQFVEQRRPDLLGLFPLIVTDPAYANVGRVLDQALISGRPVYLIKPMAGLELKADLTPAGSLYRATPINPIPGQPLDVALPPVILTTASEETRNESVTLHGYDLAPDRAAPGDTVTLTLYWQVTQPLTVDYTSYVHLIDTAGQGLAQSDHRPGGEFYPSTLWQPGEILRDQHTLTLPAELEQGMYQFRAGLYHQPEPGNFAGMGVGEVIGRLTIF